MYTNDLANHHFDMSQVQNKLGHFLKSHIRLKTSCSAKERNLINI